ncbi:MAG: NUDIX domain-containing protein [bacterium]|nr:NUDIX domain-containing protein [bacterium]
MRKRSAGIVLYRRRGEEIEVLLVHFGGPYWAGKDEGAWTIPKGEYDPALEAGEAAARREFKEETGQECPGRLGYIGEVEQGRFKVTDVWMAEGEIDAENVRSNMVEMEWPRGSGKIERFPEVDRAAWFELGTARRKLCKSMAPVIELVEQKLGREGVGEEKGAGEEEERD